MIGNNFLMNRYQESNCAFKIHLIRGPQIKPLHNLRVLELMSHDNNAPHCEPSAIKANIVE
jgi:hypothetical protein